MQCEKCGEKIEDAKILSHAAKLRSKMRRTHGGGAPLKVFQCRFCHESLRGRAALELHEAGHAGPVVGIDPEDLEAWA